VHNCETSWGLLDFHLLSPLFQDQIPFDPHQRTHREEKYSKGRESRAAQRDKGAQSGEPERTAREGGSQKEVRRTFKMLREM